MFFPKKAIASIAAIVALAAPAHSVAMRDTQMPKSTFDGAHNTNWDPSSVDRIESVQAKIASTASWYGVPDGFHGRRTANGEIFDAYGLTAAHRTLPFGTRVKVTNLNNGRSAIVRINDRGPFVAGRTIDLSQGAASRIGLTSSGVAPVAIQVLR